MKKLLIGAILLFSVMSCSQDETPIDEVAYLNKDLLNVKPIHFSSSNELLKQLGGFH